MGNIKFNIEEILTEARYRNKYDRPLNFTNMEDIMIVESILRERKYPKAFIEKYIKNLKKNLTENVDDEMETDEDDKIDIETDDLNEILNKIKKFNLESEYGDIKFLIIDYAIGLIKRDVGEAINYIQFADSESSLYYEDDVKEKIIEKLKKSGLGGYFTNKEESKDTEIEKNNSPEKSELNNK